MLIVLNLKSQKSIDKKKKKIHVCDLRLGMFDDLSLISQQYPECISKRKSRC